MDEVVAFFSFVLLIRISGKDQTVIIEKPLGAVR